MLAPMRSEEDRAEVDMPADNAAGRPWARAAEGGIRSTEAPEHGFLGQLQTARGARRNILRSRNERVDP